MKVYNLLDLFSGIGGFSLGLERTGGFKTVAFCEIEPYPCKILKQHWPEVPIYGDIRELTADRLAADGIAVDAICGGFPCQDISTAGKGAGIEGERSGLWREYARLIGELRPRYVFVENVSALLGRGLDRVLGDLASLGYDAEWHCIPASAIGAPHRRDRLWIVAHSMRGRWEQGNICRPGDDEQTSGKRESVVSIQSGSSSTSMADTSQLQRNVSNNNSALSVGSKSSFQPRNNRWTGDLADTSSARLQGNEWEGPAGTQRVSTRHLAQCSGWSSEPQLGRLAHGVPNRVDRLKALGNAVVPQIPEMIGRAVLEWEADR